VRVVSSQRLNLRPNTTVVVVALVVTALDALTKAWARHALATRAVHLAGGAWLRLAYNSGISFSLHQGGALVTSVVTVAVALGVLVVGLRARVGAPAVGFGLLIGGGLANVIDRLAASPHRVTDFVALGSFPLFNLADACITAGFIVLVVVVARGEPLVRS
jgi:signal peptidase II